ncbi:Coilin [Orchesella cincta]|uniref:Coilin n=1 Tax=Orchesella cincta TaxID=48709 RepID=A0A1D2N1L1_ORCCI|nr:Coilin [Orchesella cincta]
MAVVGDSPDVQNGRLIGLKLEVSPEIIPRDTSVGTKIFMLLPGEAKSVRDVKRYIGNYVIKTPAPFHIYMGEYRIRDEEDAQIFSLITEPCRLMPVPIPRPALSSTPKPKSATVASDGGSGGKRVTFFDGDISASPVRRPGENGVDVLDDSQSSAQTQSMQSQIHFFTPSPSLMAQKTRQLEGAVEDEDSSTERKRRRRRKHRSRKSTSRSITDVVEDGMPISVGVDNSHSSLKRKTPVDSETAAASMDSVNGNNTTNEKLGILNEETESEDETKEGDTETETRAKEFLSPKVVERKNSEPLRKSKRQKLSDSAFASSESFLSPVSSAFSDDSDLRVGKVRQDTPIVPRVVKNPRVFESARKILHSFSDTNSIEPLSSTDNKYEDVKAEMVVAENNGDSVDSSKVAPLKPKDEEYYKALLNIENVGEVEVGDKIAFKVLELDERYNPSVSAYKEAVVTEKIGSQLTIDYLKNEKVIRTGIYDLPTGDERGNKILELGKEQQGTI